MANPYGVQYGQSGQQNYYPQTELLPNFRRTPPPEELKAQAWQNFNDYALPLASFAGGQIAEKAALLGLTGKSLGQWAKLGANRALHSPLATAATYAIASRYPGLASGVGRIVSSPAGQKAAQFAEKAIDWIF